MSEGYRYMVVTSETWGIFVTEANPYQYNHISKSGCKASRREGCG